MLKSIPFKFTIALCLLLVLCRLGKSQQVQCIINDDYCDCGNDEPGTSACSGTLSSQSFACTDDRVKSMSLIPSSRVDDGVCDCCDGSDESKMQCENTCNEMLEALKKADDLRNKARELKKRIGMVSNERFLQLKKASVGITDAPTRTKLQVATLQEKIIQLKDLKKKFSDNLLASKPLLKNALSPLTRPLRMRLVALWSLMGEEDVVEGVFNVCDGKYDAEGDDEADDTEALSLAIEYRKSSIHSSSSSSQSSTSPSSSLSSLPDNTESNVDAMIVALTLNRLSDDSLLDALIEISILCAGKGILENMIRDSSLATSIAPSIESFQSILTVLSDLDKTISIKRNPEKPLATPLQIDENVRHMELEIGSLEAKLQSARKEAAEAENLSKFDFGSSNVYFAFWGRCFHYTDNQKMDKYEICPFGVSKQNRILLGTWEKHVAATDQQNEDAYFKFMKGERCLGLAHKPERQLILRLKCGLPRSSEMMSDSTPITEETMQNLLGYIESVDELEVCKYEAVLTTPLAC